MSAVVRSAGSTVLCVTDVRSGPHRSRRCALVSGTPHDSHWPQSPAASPADRAVRDLVDVTLPSQSERACAYVAARTCCFHAGVPRAVSESPCCLVSLSACAMKGGASSWSWAKYLRRLCMKTWGRELSGALRKEEKIQRCLASARRTSVIQPSSPSMPSMCALGYPQNDPLDIDVELELAEHTSEACVEGGVLKEGRCSSARVNHGPLTGCGYRCGSFCRVLTLEP